MFTGLSKRLPRVQGEEIPKGVTKGPMKNKGRLKDKKERDKLYYYPRALSSFLNILPIALFGNESKNWIDFGLL